MLEILKQNGYHDFFKSYSESEKEKPTFCLITGETKFEDRVRVLEVINDKSNMNGEKVKVILISSAAAEGINFRNVRFSHLLEPYWNASRLKQVIARAVRNYSHKDLPEEKRVVKSFLYISTISGLSSIDEHLYEISTRKENIIVGLMNELKRVSINCMH